MGNGVESEVAQNSSEKDGNFTAWDAPGESHPDSKVNGGEHEGERCGDQT